MILLSKMSPSIISFNNESNKAIPFCLFSLSLKIDTSSPKGYLNLQGL